MVEKYRVYIEQILVSVCFTLMSMHMGGVKLKLMFQRKELEDFLVDRKFSTKLELI
jgi:hypothetical protein